MLHDPEDKTGDLRIEYLHDYQSRRTVRIETKHPGKENEEQRTTCYLYDDWNLLAELDFPLSPPPSVPPSQDPSPDPSVSPSREKSPVRFFTWGRDLSGSLQGAVGVGGLLAVSEGESHRFPAYDANGNVSQLVDELGAITAAYTYDPFGNVTEMAGQEAEENPWRFSTKPVDAGTGWLYYGFRYYQPETGRWLSRDPIGERGGENLYGFVRNTALNGWDLLGLTVTAVFNVREGLLSITDDDTGESAVIRATAGIPELSNRFDKEWEKGGPLPRGEYEILNRIMNGATDEDGNLTNILDRLQVAYGVWALDYIDSIPRNDGTGRGRGQFRLHPFGSEGCVVTDDLTDYAKVAAILNNTKTLQVKDSQGRTRTYYGVMSVVSPLRAVPITEENNRLQGPKKKSLWEKLFGGKSEPKFE